MYGTDYHQKYTRTYFSISVLEWIYLVGFVLASLPLVFTLPSYLTIILLLELFTVAKLPSVAVRNARSYIMYMQYGIRSVKSKMENI